jgi:hypothetical protein
MSKPLRLRTWARACAIAVSALCVCAQPADPKFDAIKAKRDRGERLTPEEREYGQAVLKQRNREPRRAGPDDAAKTTAPRTSTGFVPLTDLAAGDYKGEPGGLYPEKRNTPPAGHAAAGLKLARTIVPLNASGEPAAGGKIVLLSVGMSNATQEFQAFQRLAAKDASLNPRLVIVDGAQGGQTASVTAQPDANYWTVNAARLKSAGVTAAQVQAVWIKQANARPTAAFPTEARKLQADLAATLHNLHAKFPNLKIAYLSSRTYGGYATTTLNPEPHAYETGFAVKWLIADQIAGKTELQYAGGRDEVRAPWIAWGPYLWTDGTKGRADGLVWQADDCRQDGTHPSESGQRKVAELLLRFLKTEPTAKPWFLKTSD